MGKNKQQVAYAWLCKIERLLKMAQWTEMLQNVNGLVKYANRYGFFDVKFMAEICVVEMCLSSQSGAEGSDVP